VSATAATTPDAYAMVLAIHEPALRLLETEDISSPAVFGAAVAALDEGDVPWPTAADGKVPGVYMHSIVHTKVLSIRGGGGGGASGLPRHDATVRCDRRSNPTTRRVRDDSSRIERDSPRVATTK